MGGRNRQTKRKSNDSKHAPKPQSAGSGPSKGRSQRRRRDGNAPERGGHPPRAPATLHPLGPVSHGRFDKTTKKKGGKGKNKEAEKEKERALELNLPSIKLDKATCNKLDYAIKAYHKLWTLVESNAHHHHEHPKVQGARASAEAAAAAAEESDSSSSSSDDEDEEAKEAQGSWETLPLDQSTESLGIPPEQGRGSGKRAPRPSSGGRAVAQGKDKAPRNLTPGGQGPNAQSGSLAQATAALQGMALSEGGSGAKAAGSTKKKEIFLPHIAVSRESLDQAGLRGIKPRPARRVNTALSRTLLEEFNRKQAVPAYQTMMRQRMQLPAWEHKDMLLDAIHNHQVVVVSGETGCGKSTQVPQFILDDFLQRSRGSECNILVTQPRRISAIGVADRVASERAERLAQSVGYQIHLESKMSKATRILFCTTGILLRKLEGSLSAGSDRADMGIDSVSHIIVDEVHERSLESDFLLMVLRELLRTRKDLKVILMSATLNANLFSDYFGNGVPTVHIPGRTFPVKVMFLEEVLARTGYRPEGPNYQKPRNQLTRPPPPPMTPPATHKGNGPSPIDVADATLLIADEDLSLEQLGARYPRMQRTAVEALKLMDVTKIQYPLIEQLLEGIITELLPPRGFMPVPGAPVLRKGGKTKEPAPVFSILGGRLTGEPKPNRGILIFMPGYAEISALHDLIRTNAKIRDATGNGRYLLPLHSSLTTQEQLLVFANPPEGSVKVVISTNVAETSVTIDDIVFVIDCCKMKEVQFDPVKGMSSLEEVWVSRANAVQRRGRAGRVTTGTCIHLVTSHHYENMLLPQQLPEIKRTPLEQICLRIKTLPFLVGGIAAIISRVIEPPEPHAVEAAIGVLKMLSALTKEEELTPLGFHLGRLPVDVRIGKFILLGSMFHCLDSALTIAAIMSSKSPFVSPFEKRDEADARKRTFSFGNSDFITMLHAYRTWQEVCREGARAEWDFANENFLSVKTLRMISATKRQLAELVSDIGFIPPLRARDMERAGRLDGGSDGVAVSLGEDPKLIQVQLLKALLVAALYPQLLKVQTGKKGGITLMDANEPVFIHPSSVNAGSKTMSGDFIVYHEKVKTTKLYVRDSCAVSALTVALFGGDFRWKHKKLCSDDDWIVIRTERQTAVHLIAARGALEELLYQKIAKPNLNISQEPIITEIVQLIERC